MRKSKVISVIVPVYRVEPYLEECIESILKQSYPQLEVILVDDGSPDRCGLICDGYAQKDQRIIVIHQKNAGAAAARNAGLRVASGEYIAFVDGDDFLEPDACENLLQAMLEHDADIVQAGFRYLYATEAHIHPVPGQPRIDSTTGYLARFTRDWTCALCWDKLFRHHVLTDVFFEEGHLIDDEFFTYQAVMNAGRIVSIPAVTYNYRQRASGVMKNPATEERKNLDALEALQKRMVGVSARFPELRDLFERHYAEHLLWLSSSEQAPKNTITQIKKSLLTFVASGRFPFWKKGRRTQAARILRFLLTSTESILNHQKKGTNDREFTLFE